MAKSNPLEAALTRKQGSHARNLDALKADVAGEGTKRLNVEFPKSRYDLLKIRAVQEGVSISDLVRRLVDRYLDE